MIAAQHQALEAIAPIRSNLQRRVLNQFANGNFTADEVAGILGISILTARPRVAELVKRGFLTESGQRRPNATGRPATVWTIKEDGQQLLPLTAPQQRNGLTPETKEPQ